MELAKHKPDEITRISPAETQAAFYQLHLISSQAATWNAAIEKTQLDKDRVKTIYLRFHEEAYIWPNCNLPAPEGNLQERQKGVFYNNM